MSRWFRYRSPDNLFRKYFPDTLEHVRRLVGQRRYRKGEGAAGEITGSVAISPRLPHRRARQFQVFGGCVQLDWQNVKGPLAAGSFPRVTTFAEYRFESVIITSRHSLAARFTECTVNRACDTDRVKLSSDKNSPATFIRSRTKTARVSRVQTTNGVLLRNGT